jgi:hypothetical protein
VRFVERGRRVRSKSAVKRRNIQIAFIPTSVEASASKLGDHIPNAIDVVEAAVLRRYVFI